MIKIVSIEIQDDGDDNSPEDRSDKPVCPFCRSERVTVKRRGFDWGCAAFTSAMFGPQRGGSAGILDEDRLCLYCDYCNRAFDDVL